MYGVSGQVREEPQTAVGEAGGLQGRGEKKNFVWLLLLLFRCWDHRCLRAVEASSQQQEGSRETVHITSA